MINFLQLGLIRTVNGFENWYKSWNTIKKKVYTIKLFMSGIKFGETEIE